MQPQRNTITIGMFVYTPPGNVYLFYLFHLWSFSSEFYVEFYLPPVWFPAFFSLIKHPCTRCSFPFPRFLFLFWIIEFLKFHFTSQSPKRYENRVCTRNLKRVIIRIVGSYYLGSAFTWDRVNYSATASVWTYSCGTGVRPFRNCWTRNSIFKLTNPLELRLGLFVAKRRRTSTLVRSS